MTTDHEFAKGLLRLTVCFCQFVLSTIRYSSFTVLIPISCFLPTFCLLRRLFNDAISNSHYRMKRLNKEMQNMGRKRYRSSLRYYPVIFLHGLSKLWRNLDRIFGKRFKFQNRNGLNKSQTLPLYIVCWVQMFGSSWALSTATSVCIYQKKLKHDPALSWFRRFVIGFSLQVARFDPRPLQVGVLVHKV